MSQQVIGRHWETGQIVAVHWAGDTITAVTPVINNPLSGTAVSKNAVNSGQNARPDAAFTAATLPPWIAPALCDLQVNGYAGTWFSSRDLTVETARDAIISHVRHGVSQLLPTLITASEETLLHSFRTLEQARSRDPALQHAVPGYHLEGPFISPADGPRGAHPREHVRAADWELVLRLNAAAGGRIRLITVAPEVPGIVPVIRAAVRNGIVVAIGHTAANREQLDAAVDAGASLSTHLGNGAAAQLPRHPNVIWDQLGDDRLAASLIADGIHLSDRVLRSLVRAKSPARCLLTCDASGWAGCQPGTYRNELGTADVLADGRIVISGQTTLLAGSSATTLQCVANVASIGAATLAESIEMAARSPRTLLGLPAAELAAGHRADFLQFDFDTATGRIALLNCWQNGVAVR